jgi:hypothetical protein
MTLGGLGTRNQSGRRINFLGIISSAMLLTGIVLFGQQLVTYSAQDFDNLQTDVIIAGIQVGGLSESEAQARWEAVFLDQPITLIYRNSPIVLNPRSLGFRTNSEAMLAAARSQSNTENSFWSGFWAHLMREAPDPVSVPLDAAMQEGQLRAVLEDIALRYDSGPGSTGFDLTSLTFQSGSSGSRLDIETSIDIVEQTLFNPDPSQRTVELPTQGVSSSGSSMDDLRNAIIAFMESQGFLYDGDTTIGSVFVLDLNTGQEMSILGDVAHSAVSTIKIPIMINYYRNLITSPPVDEAYLLASAVICSHNTGANFIMQVSSDSRTDIIQGMQRASQTMLAAGAINSWITSPLFVGPEGEYPIIAPPERPNLPNQNHDAHPDPLNQTTAEDMGTLMGLIYDCAIHDGGLRAIFPEEITQDECIQMIEVMSGVKFSRFSELGIPEDTFIAHKVGYGQETVGDVALIYSPGANYVFSIYIWEEDLDNDRITELDKWDMIDEIARIVYNYFNPTQPLLEPRQPANALGGAACVLPGTDNIEAINLNDIDAGRFDANGDPLPEACYDWPLCRPFDNWGQGETP